MNNKLSKKEDNLHKRIEKMEKLYNDIKEASTKDEKEKLAKDVIREFEIIGFVFNACKNDENINTEIGGEVDRLYRYASAILRRSMLISR
ncbi:MAG: hypothetical protein LBP63_01645 [Prevotellaceae bacterium]|jgi:hypothetical protein|nr:hypothetical protein [Prevotellaceae bacterium]